MLPLLFFVSLSATAVGPLPAPVLLAADATGELEEAVDFDAEEAGGVDAAGAKPVLVTMPEQETHAALALLPLSILLLFGVNVVWRRRA